MNLPELNFPKYSFRIRNSIDYYEIFDKIRRKWVKLNPEEWVRQHLIWYLIEEAKCPEGLMQVEFPLSHQGKVLRIDVAVFSNNSIPVLLCECKAPNVVLTNSALTQMALYNISYQSPHLLLTNGLQHFCFYFKNEWFLKNNIPTYQELLNAQ